MGGALTIGVIGVGVISAQYFAELPKLAGLKLLAVADLDEVRAADVSAQQGVESLSVDALLADPRIDAVLNLTTPATHVEIGTRALHAGKHVFSEKPLALTPEDAAPMLELARSRGLRVGCAPDTVLGTGVQTARAVLDSGEIGEPVAASVHWSSPGHELWHPSPQLYYQPGAGPLFDMAPYYLSSLITLFGPVLRVSGTSTRSGRERTIATGPLATTAVPVDVDTHVSAILDHGSGVSSTITVSFGCGPRGFPCSRSMARPAPSQCRIPTTFPTLWRSGHWRARAGRRPLCQPVTPTQGVESASRTWPAPSIRAARTAHPVIWHSTYWRSWMPF